MMYQQLTTVIKPVRKGVFKLEREQVRVLQEFEAAGARRSAEKRQEGLSKCTSI